MLIFKEEWMLLWFLQARESARPLRIRLRASPALVCPVLKDLCWKVWGGGTYPTPEHSHLAVVWGMFSVFAPARGSTVLLRQVPSQRMPGCPCACSESLIVVPIISTSKTSERPFGHLLTFFRITRDVLYWHLALIPCVLCTHITGLDDQVLHLC